MSDDPSLLRLYAESGSEPAFAEFVQRHLPLVYGAALRRTNGDAHRAHDVAQLVFTTVAGDASRLSRHPSLTGWLFTATRHAAANLMRAERRRATREQAAHLIAEMNSPEPEADWQRVRPVLDAALDELDDRDREAVLLRFFEHQPLVAIAAALRVSEDAARKRVDRAMDRLGGLLAKRGVTSTGAALTLAFGAEAAIAVPANLAGTITAAAIAGAAGTAGTATTLSLITAMTTSSKIITGVSAAIAIAALGTAVFQANVVKTSNASVLQLQSERDTLATRITALEKQVQEADARRAAAEAAAAVPAKSESPKLQHGSSLEYVLTHPETHAAYVEHQALRSFSRLGAFIASARLTPEQQERLLGGLRKVAGAEFDFLAAMHSQGYGVGFLPKDPKAVQALRAPIVEAQKAFASEMRETLGDSGFKELMEYSKWTAERNVTDQLAARLCFTDHALTREQATSLVQILAQDRLAPMAAGTPKSTMNGTSISRDALNGAIAQSMQQGGLTLTNWHAPISDAAMARASTLLKPEQLAALRHVQAEQIAQLHTAPPPPAGFLGGPR